MLKKITFFILLLHSVQAFSQKTYVNYDIDTTVYKVSAPLNLWLDFLNTKDDSLGAKYWNSEEVSKYGVDSYFLLEGEMYFGTNNFLELLSYSTVKTLSISKVGRYHKITSLMEFNAKGDKSNLQFIFHVYAGEENGELKLFNAISVNSKLMFSNTTVGKIHYHYPKAHVFDFQLAEKQHLFLEELSHEFGVKYDSMDYYFAPTSAEILKVKGIDFMVGYSGNQVPSGKADTKNRIAYSTGLGEYYPHEMIHILLNPIYPNCHLWAIEGVTTFFGRSRGKDLDWHLKRVNQHLLNHPEMNLNQLFEHKSLDEYTDYKYAIGGFIVREVYRKGGYELLKNMLDSGVSDSEFYNFIEKNLNVKQVELNTWIRSELKKMYSDEMK